MLRPVPDDLTEASFTKMEKWTCKIFHCLKVCHSIALGPRYIFEILRKHAKHLEQFAYWTRLDLFQIKKLNSFDIFSRNLSY